MKITFNSRSKKESGESPLMQRLKGFIEKTQHTAAGTLNRKGEKSPGVIRAIVIAACVLLCLASLWILKNAVTQAAESRMELKIPLPVIHVPKMPHVPIDARPVAVLRRIERTKHYLDSLSKTTAGKMTRDSILASRPGLMDSMENIEQLYN